MAGLEEEFHGFFGVVVVDSWDGADYVVEASAVVHEDFDSVYA